MTCFRRPGPFFRGSGAKEWGRVIWHFTFQGGAGKRSASELQGLASGGLVLADVKDSGVAGDPHDLDRFVRAQAGDYERALSEIRTGRKRSHWMWYTFPQIEGLGSSAMAQRYAIKSLAEARTYLDHALLGPRLIACVEALLGIEDRSAEQIFGFPDDRKLRSCATLFAEASPPGSVFHRLLDKYFQGVRDPVTLRLLLG